MLQASSFRVDEDGLSLEALMDENYISWGDQKKLKWFSKGRLRWRGLKGEKEEDEVRCRWIGASGLQIEKRKYDIDGVFKKRELIKLM